MEWLYDVFFFAALNYHFESQCIPTPLSWYVHHFPNWLMRLGVVGTFVIEIPIPFLFFAPVRALRLFSFYSQVRHCFYSWSFYHYPDAIIHRTFVFVSLKLRYFYKWPLSGLAITISSTYLPWHYASHCWMIGICCGLQECLGRLVLRNDDLVLNPHHGCLWRHWSLECTVP